MKYTDWIPDYRKPEEYPDPDKVTYRQLAWEFLRRNPDFIKCCDQIDFDIFKAARVSFAASRLFTDEENAFKKLDSFAPKQIWYILKKSSFVESFAEIAIRLGKFDENTYNALMDIYDEFYLVTVDHYKNNSSLATYATEFIRYSDSAIEEKREFIYKKRKAFKSSGFRYKFRNAPISKKPIAPNNLRSKYDSIKIDKLNFNKITFKINVEEDYRQKIKTFNRFIFDYEKSLAAFKEMGLKMDGDRPYKEDLIEHLKVIDASLRQESREDICKFLYSETMEADYVDPQEMENCFRNTDNFIMRAKKFNSHGYLLLAIYSETPKLKKRLI